MMDAALSQGSRVACKIPSARSIGVYAVTQTIAWFQKNNLCLAGKQKYVVPIFQSIWQVMIAVRSSIKALAVTMHCDSIER